MMKPYVTHIVLQQYHSSSIYSEREAAAASNLSIGALRSLRAFGLVMGEGSGKQRRYSEEDVLQLRRIHRLHHELGINLAGIEVILHLLERLDAVEQELAQERKDHEHRAFY